MIPLLHHSALLFTFLPYSILCAVRHKEHPHPTALSLPLPRSEHSSWDTTGSEVGPSRPGPGIYFKRRNVCKRTLAHNKNVGVHTYTITQLISMRRTDRPLFPSSNFSVKVCLLPLQASTMGIIFNPVKPAFVHHLLQYLPHHHRCSHFYIVHAASQLKHLVYLCVHVVLKTFCHFLKLTLRKYRVFVYTRMYICVSPSVSVTPHLMDCQATSANILVKLTVCVCRHLYHMVFLSFSVFAYVCVF